MARANTRYWVTAGAGVILVGSFMPWATVQSIFGSLSQSGFDAGDGVLTASGSIVVGGIGVVSVQRVERRTPHVLLKTLALVFTAVTGLVVVHDIADLNRAINEVDTGGLATISVGTGLRVSRSATCVRHRTGRPGSRIRRRCRR